MTATVEVRRARLSDAEAIAGFVNAAHSDVSRQGEITGLSVVQRFGQIGFMLAERAGQVVGLLGWQIENLIVRVTDCLIAASGAEAMRIARALIETMEAEARELRAEAALLFLPAEPSAGLVRFWESLGYDAECLDALGAPCREAANEWGLSAERVMIKYLREEPIGRPV
ncbi:MAG: hypothetical protein JXC32_15665 [Anaerolineae bacterium]|nr:hypothetical protein [Anaerolineae bacterium]